jgi:hypothetical protein
MDFNVAIDQFPANATIQLHYHTIDGTAVSTGTVTAGTLDFVASDGSLPSPPMQMARPRARSL